MNSADSPTFDFVVCVILLVFSAFFSATETAVTALSRKKLQEFMDTGGPIAKALGLWYHNPDRVLATLLIGNTLVNIAASVLAARIAHYYLDSYADAVAVAAMTLIVLTFGEVMPKSLARVVSVRIAPTMMNLLRPIYWLLFPVSWVFARVAGRLVRIVLGPDHEPGPTVTEGELEYLIEVGQREGIFEEADQGKLLGAVVEFNETVAREAMVPRVDVIALDAQASLQDALEVATRSGHSRIPVFDGEIDKVVGILHVKELLAIMANRRTDVANVGAVARKKVLYVPETQRIAEILKEIKRRASHLAVVVDEFGGMAGIITLEDIIEELVGDIRDEFDGDEEVPIQSDGHGGTRVLGKVSLFDLAEYLNTDFPEHADFDTVGGLLAAELGHLPEVGEAMTWAGYRFEVRRADERRVHEVCVTPATTMTSSCQTGDTESPEA